jgi:hypothetical protein
VWSRDSLWQGLEGIFAVQREQPCSSRNETATGFARADSLLQLLTSTPLSPKAFTFDSLEAQLFALGPHAAACTDDATRYVALHDVGRSVVKAQSTRWDLQQPAARERLYRALYGTRAAVEEVQLQQPASAPALTVSALVWPESPVPSATVQGVTLRSGDLLVSRGGYPTSALIARGSDYPGNFSHVALVHVDSATRAVSVVEAHIEAGVAIATAAQYLADRKLRVLVLRPRADLPALVRDPWLPHRAASAMLERARLEHVPYDFAMDYTDPARLFCSEVASAAYATEGVALWMGISTITRDGLRRWLSAFGVRHFATQEPSDLEYDPQVAVVAEWRDPDALLADHIDNAVTDVMLDEADAGAALAVSRAALPVARLLKGWSALRVALGGRGPIPEGMSPSAALRNRAYRADHTARAARLREAVDAFRDAEGYGPPYWTLVRLARETASAL